MLHPLPPAHAHQGSAGVPLPSQHRKPRSIPHTASLLKLFRDPTHRSPTLPPEALRPSRARPGLRDHPPCFSRITLRPRRSPCAPATRACAEASGPVHLPLLPGTPHGSPLHFRRVKYLASEQLSPAMRHAAPALHPSHNSARHRRTGPTRAGTVPPAAVTLAPRTATDARIRHQHVFAEWMNMSTFCMSDAADGGMTERQGHKLVGRQTRNTSSQQSGNV